MNAKDREILIRIDERQKDMHEDVKNLKGLYPKVEKNTTDIHWIRIIGGGIAAIGAGIVGMVEWFKAP